MSRIKFPEGRGGMKHTDEKINSSLQIGEFANLLNYFVDLSFIMTS